jgi:diguanylate cyclase (GGDEF)-like protein
LKPLSVRALSLAYIVALLIIACLSIVSHIALDYSLERNEGSAAIINQTGRQRMLSQRIAALAAEYRLGDASAHAALRSAVEMFAQSHASLTEALRIGSRDGGAAGELAAIYFTGPHPLDAEVGTFVADARQVLDRPSDDPAVGPIVFRLAAEARAPLLNALEQVVTIEQAESERRIHRLEQLQWAVLAVVLATLAIEAMLIFRPMIRRIAAYTSELLRLATTDPLTGTANRRAFLARSEAEITRARRFSRPVSLLMFDLDHFKSINDTYGHAAGDEVLKAVGQVLLATLRPVDIPGRLGGEEFGVLLVETALPEAALVAERLRERLQAMVVRHGDNSIRFTVSVGATSLGTQVQGLEGALQIADKLMYRAKQTGRNRIVVD